MGINYYGQKSSNDAIPVGSLVYGVLNGDETVVPAAGQILERVDYPTLYDRIGLIPDYELVTQTVSPFGSTEALDVVSNGTNLIVAIAGGGQVATSSNGTSWTLAGSTVVNAAVLSYVANNTTFYLSTTDGKLYSSTNGTTWTLRATFSGKKLGKVIYGGGGYFVSNRQGDVYSSTNGTSFTLDMSNGQAYGTDPVWDGTNLFVITYDTSDAVFYRIKMDWSGSDLTWGSPSFSVTNLDGMGTATAPEQLLSFSGKYIMYGSIVGDNYKALHSTDMITWTASTGGTSNTGSSSNAKFTVGGTRLICSFSSNLATTTNGTTYTNQTSAFYVAGDTSASKINGAAYISVGTVWAKVGGNGKVASGNSTATTWTLQTTPFTASASTVANAVASNGTDTFLLVGASGVVAQSSTGVSWASVTSGVATTLNAVGYGNGKWLIGGSSTVLRYSTDLVTFTACSGHAGTTYNLAYGNGVWVALTSTGVYKSGDGITFTVATTPLGVIGSSDAQRLAFGNGLFVAVVNGAIYNSVDGDVWTQVVNPTTVAVERVFFNGTIFMSGDNASNKLLRSSDGVSWEETNLTGILTGAVDGVFTTSNFGVTVNGDFLMASGTGLPASGQQLASHTGIVVTTGTGSILRGYMYTYNKTNQFKVPYIAGTYANRPYYKAI